MRLWIKSRKDRIACLAILLLGSASLSCRGACLPLRSADLQSLDRDTEDDPARAIASVEERLRAPDEGGSPFRQAELYSLLAEAQGGLSRPDEARAAIKTALGKLAAPPAEAATERLRLRLNLLDSILDVIVSRSAAAVQSTDRLLVGLPNDSLERACTLAVRAQAWWSLNQQDHAVADALGAYRLAEDHGWTNARLEAASALARIFKRAGLYEQAERMVDDVIEVATEEKRTSMLSTGEYELGLILMLENRYSDARKTLEASRALSEQLGDRFGVAVVNVPICWTQVAEGDLNSAEQTCYTGEAELVAAQRPDLVATARALRARIDLGRGHPAAALSTLNQLLAASLDGLTPALKPRVYRDRAQALAELHRYPQAYADLRRASELEQSANGEQRNREVAVLSALVTSEKLIAANRLLVQQLSNQVLENRAQQQARRLWAIVSAATLLLCFMFACLLLLTRRHSRTLRRQETILRAAGHSAPDALVLLDQQYRVRFGNRNLFGHATMHPIGEPLGVGVPAEALPTLTDAIDQVTQQHLPVTFYLGVKDHAVRDRQYEIHVVPAIEDGFLVGVTLRSLDVTDLRHLAREVIDDASRERQRFSSDLHEGLGQELAGVMLMLGSLSTKIKQALPDAAVLADQIASYVAQSVVLTRELARGLSPVHIVRGSLGDALDALARDTEKRLSVRIICDCWLDGVAVSNTAADHLYRICREAITNALLHGRCTQIELQIRIDAGDLRLSIADNGSGVRSDRALGDGLGLRLMAYRTRLLGGELRFRPNQAGGTNLTVVVPISQLTDTPTRADS